MESNQKFWEIWKAVSTTVGIILIPILVAVIANIYAKASKESELKNKYVEMALEILKNPDSANDENLKEWAVDLINANSQLPLSPEAKKELITISSLPSGIKVTISNERAKELANKLKIPEIVLLRFIESMGKQGITLSEIDKNLDNLSSKYIELLRRISTRKKSWVQSAAIDALANGDFESAEEILTLSLNKGLKEIRVRKTAAAKDYLEMAKLYKDQNKLEESIEAYEKALELINFE